MAARCGAPFTGYRQSILSLLKCACMIISLPKRILEEGDLWENLNPNSLEVSVNARVEPRMQSVKLLRSLPV